eukprot:scaffold112259_cov59-Phaeocystis_antarctica.AAC.5
MCDACNPIRGCGGPNSLYKAVPCDKYDRRSCRISNVRRERTTHDMSPIVRALPCTHARAVRASVLPTAPLIASPHRPRRSHTGRGPCPTPNRRSPSDRPPSSPRSHHPDARHAARHAAPRCLLELPSCRLVVWVDPAAWTCRCRW